MWLIVGQLPIKTGWWDPPHELRNFNRSNKHCQSSQLGSEMSPLLLNKNMIKRESRIGYPLDSNWGPRDWLPMVTATILSSAATEKSHNILTPIHKVLEQPRRRFASLKLCKCFQIPHSSTRVSSTFCRWYMLWFDTSYKGGKSFLPILKLLGLTCVICCN